jgi:hypothetical protein
VPDPLATSQSARYRELLGTFRAWAGEVLTAQMLQAQVPGFKAQKGIYKPANSEYALWVRETAQGPYSDEAPEYAPDGSWTYRYSPEAHEGGTAKELYTNRGLRRCMEDRVPVGVFRQDTSIGGRTAYKGLGLAFVESFDGSHFLLRGEPIDETNPPIDPRVAAPFEAFERPGSPVEQVVRTMRERRFSSELREVYHQKCSLCSVGYRYRGRTIALEGAHLIPVESRGVIGDIRNGILLCRNHHALFDSYAWTLDEDLRVLLATDREFRSSALANHVLAFEGKRLPNLPESAANFPADDAVRWRLAEFNDQQRRP